MPRYCLLLKVLFYCNIERKKLSYFVEMINVNLTSSPSIIGLLVPQFTNSQNVNPTLPPVNFIFIYKWMKIKSKRFIYHGMEENGISLLSIPLKQYYFNVNTTLPISKSIIVLRHHTSPHIYDPCKRVTFYWLLHLTSN